MSTLNKVFAKFSAQEPMRVELGMAQDIQKDIAKAESLFKSSLGSVGQILKAAVDKIDAEVRPLNDLRVKLYTQGQKFKTQSEQLGLDSSEVMRDVNNAIDAIDKRVDYMQQVNNVIRQNF